MVPSDWGIAWRYEFPEICGDLLSDAERQIRDDLNQRREFKLVNVPIGEYVIRDGLNDMTVNATGHASYINWSLLIKLSGYEFVKPVEPEQDIDVSGVMEFLDGIEVRED